MKLEGVVDSAANAARLNMLAVPSVNPAAFKKSRRFVFIDVEDGRIGAIDICFLSEKPRMAPEARRKREIPGIPDHGRGGSSSASLNPGSRRTHEPIHDVEREL